MTKFTRSLSFDDVLLIPGKSYIRHRADVDISTTISGLHLEIPIVSANMSSVTGVEMAAFMTKIGGMGLLHRMYGTPEAMAEDVNEAYYSAGRTAKGILGFSFGIGTDWERWVELGFGAGAKICCLDVAHAHHSAVLEVVERFAMRYPHNPIIVGNIATSLAAKEIRNVYTSAYPNSMKQFPGQLLTLKVGIGGGSLCTTRIMTGCGVPTLQSIMDVDSGSDVM